MNAAGVPAVDTLWDQLRGTAPFSMQGRILLDLVGIGLEQAHQTVRELSCPAAFERWISETSGPPNREQLDRYHAWLDGAPPPQATQQRFEALAAMPPVLDAGDLAHWEREGYVVLRNAITPDEAAAAAEFVWQSQGAVPRDPASWYAAMRNQGIFIQLFQHPVLEPARRSPRVHKAFAQLWGTPDLWSSVDRIGFNPPLRENESFRAPRLHWDVSLAQPIPFATQGILYLTDTSADQGALELVPGFHHALADWLHDLGDRDPRQQDLRDRAITIPAGAGDLIIWRHDLPHGASPNRSNRPRLVQYVNMYSPELVTHPVWR